MTSALTGLLFLLWSLQLLGIVAISNTVLGLVALITGILWLVSAAGVALPNLHR
jgi:hypothetical protein